MKVWFAASIEESSNGGVQRSMVQFSRFLQSEGIQVEIIYASNKSGTNYLRFAVLLAIKYLKNLRNPPDWIIARSTDGVFCTVLIRLFSLKTKVALHNHGWEEKVYKIEKGLPREIVTNPTSWKSHLLRFPLLKANLRLADVCICGTIEEAKWISDRYKFSAKKMRVIPNGIDVADKPHWPLQKNYPLNILSVGGFTWKKNLEYSLQIFRKVLNKNPEAKFYMVGTGNIPSQRELLMDFCGESLVIIKNESPGMMNRWYEHCPFVVSTSRYEGGHAFCILEAMARGCVVFATGISSSKEIIMNYHNGILLDGTDADADCSRIMKTSLDTQSIKEIGMAAWRYAKRNRIERQANRLKKVLLE